MKIDLLDHGYVRLVSYTQPAGSVTRGYHHGSAEEWTGDLEIVRAARVSYNADWRGAGPGLHDAVPDANKDERLIHYLWTKGHTSPFEAMTFSFEVQAPIFVYRQWHRHRTQSYNEVSARYTELPELYYIPVADQVRAQSKTNKQGRGEEMDAHDVEAYRDRLDFNAKACFALYHQMLNAGVARELARLVLPLNTYSRMYASANLLNWFRFLTLRLDAHAQFEIRVYAEAILRLIATVCPIACEAFKQDIYEADPTGSPEVIKEGPDLTSINQAFYGSDDD